MLTMKRKLLYSLLLSACFLASGWYIFAEDVYELNDYPWVMCGNITVDMKLPGGGYAGSFPYSQNIVPDNYFTSTDYTDQSTGVRYINHWCGWTSEKR
jgi:hypothetical protein